MSFDGVSINSPYGKEMEGENEYNNYKNIFKFY